MKRLAHFNVGIMFALCAAFYITYYLLLEDNFLHTSISDIITRSHQLADQQHLLVLGLLPIYIATVVFGSATLGVYLGSLAQRMVLKKDQKNPMQFKTQYKI